MDLELYEKFEDLLPDSEIYDQIKDKRDVYIHDVRKSLDIVEKYIKKNGFILYGGMAIDFALKLAGEEGIYDNNVLPDYDFYSPDAYTDSIKIAILLHKEKLSNISAINGYHITTRRTRVNFSAVADLSHMPAAVFNILPTLEYKGIKSIHPDFQRLDMHRSFCYLYENPPSETFGHRTKKDIKRFSLLNNAYPTSYDKKFNIPPPKKIHFISEQVNANNFENALMGGVLGYAVCYKLVVSAMKSLESMLKKTKHYYKIADKLKKICPAKLHIKGDKIMWSYPSNVPILAKPVIITVNLSNTSKPYTGLKHYRRFLDDIRPESMENDAIIIQNGSGRLLSCCKTHELNAALETVTSMPAFNTAIYGVANIHHTMMFFLSGYFVEKTYKKPDTGGRYVYWSLLKLAECAEDILESLEQSEDDRAAMYRKNPLFINASVFGAENHNYTYQILKKQHEAKILGEKIESDRPPQGFYPDSGYDYPEFKNSDSWIYTWDGGEQEPINSAK